MTDISVQYHGVPAHQLDFVERMARLEALGIAGVLFADHFNHRLAPLPAMMAAACATDQLRVGSMVLCNDYRHPVEVAKQIATIDLLSTGRVELGVGAGWMVTDYESLGLDFDRASVRIERLDEAVRIIRSCWSGEAASHAGAHYQVGEHAAHPVPLTHPLIRLGGGGPKMLRLAATVADIVSINPTHRDGVKGLDSQGNEMTVEALSERIKRVRNWAAEVGRSPIVEIPIRAVAIGDDAEEALDAMGSMLGLEPCEAQASPYLAIGSVNAVAERIQCLSGELGIDRWVIMDHDVEALKPVLEQLRTRP